ncbi:MAG: STAS domain-containing protein [Thiotrichaceae bacterium]|nr:STAS domain-containing protein [Thiotrichaceae bacterium]
MKQSIKVIEKEQLYSVVLSGNLDAVLSPKLEASLIEQSFMEGKLIVIDLELVPSVTADGVRVLLNTYINKNQYPGGLAIANPNNEVRQLLVMVGLEDLFQV